MPQSALRPIFVPVMMPFMRIALLQHACSDDPTANLQAMHRLAHDAVEQGAELLVTQELFLGPYFCLTEDPAPFARATPIPGPATQPLADLAVELNVHLSASLFEARAPGLYHNTSALFNPAGQIVGTYRKTHIPDDPGYYEKYFFTPGDQGFVTLPVGDAHVGHLVCWDQWFPEAARLTAMQGAQLLLYPTAIGWADGEEADHAAQRDAWQTIQRSHAIANGVFVAACNRIGKEGDQTFWGSSFVADPQGRVIAEASTDQPQALVVDLDWSLIETTRQAWPFFRDRRTDLYHDLNKKWSDD